MDRRCLLLDWDDLCRSVPTLLAALLVASALPASAPAAEIRVGPAGAAVGACGADWSAACDLQYALQTVARSGDEIWVAAGTYTPGAARTSAFRLRTGVAVYGGFTGTEVSRDQRNWTANPTVLSGDIGVPGLTADNTYHVVEAVYTDATAVLDGFTISGGNAGTGVGGGMRNYQSSPTIGNCTFRGNSADNGGGLYNYLSSPLIWRCTFEGNSAVSEGGQGPGGGIFNWGGSPVISDSTFSRNSAGDGGGMYSTGSQPTITGCTFFHNVATSEAGGIYNNSSNPLIANCTFAGNSAPAGAGMKNSISTVSVAHCTFAGNAADEFYGGGAIANHMGSMTVSNTILWGNSPDQVKDDSGLTVLATSILQGECSAGLHCLDVLHANPLLGPLGDYGGATRTYLLRPGSPAIDAADWGVCGAYPVRYASQNGMPRPEYRCDIGAFEIGKKMFRWNPDHDGWVLESRETAGVGGSANRAGSELLVGDDALNRQYRSIISFDTSALPDSAKITSVELRLKPAPLIGSDPFATHGALLYDISKGAFSGGAALQRSDFEAPASRADAGRIPAVLDDLGWYSSHMPAAAFPCVNLEGLTQFRLRYSRDDDNDRRADFLALFSHEAGASDCPRLKIEYYVP